MEILSKAKIKWLRSLQQKKVREQEQLFVVEGEKMVLEGLETNGFSPEILIVTSDYEIPAHLNAYSDKMFRATTIQLEQISTLKTPNKLLAVFRRPQNDFPSKGLFIALDDVQDPGNMGTILRLADWFGAAGIVCSENTVDCYNPKVIQSSMGAIFRIPVKYCDLAKELKNIGLPVFGALLEGDNYTAVSYPKDAILLMGNEGNGISEKLKQNITQAVTIPKYGEAESLNVATAAAVLLAGMKK